MAVVLTCGVLVFILSFETSGDPFKETSRVMNKTLRTRRHAALDMDADVNGTDVNGTDVNGRTRRNLITTYILAKNQKLQEAASRDTTNRRSKRVLSTTTAYPSDESILAKNLERASRETTNRRSKRVLSTTTAYAGDES